MKLKGVLSRISLAVLVVMLVPMLMFLFTGQVGAANSVNVTITAIPSFYSINISDNTWVVGAVSENTTYWWDDEGGAQVEPGWPLDAADCAATIGNLGSVNSDIDVLITAGGIWTGGVTWTLVAVFTGTDQVIMRAYKAGDALGGTVLTGSFQELISALTPLEQKGVELKLETGRFSDGEAKTAVAGYLARAP